MAINLSDHLEQIFPPNALEEKVSSGKQLTVKLGFDPTAPDLHLGHAVVLRKLRQFQDLGHKVVVIIGDTTASIGDPTGRNKMRPPLSAEDIEQNAATYLEQLALVVDINKVEIRKNSEWFNELDFPNVLKLFSRYTVQQILQRNDFSQRYQENQPIGIHELIYPLIQGYDSVMIKADIEIGGNDQLFNCKVGRQLQEAYEQAGQAVICTTILRGTDGKEKMSKSKDNYIGLTDAPNDMYGKVMSIPDELIEEYLTLATDFSEDEIAEQKSKLAQGENPLEIKQLIALNVVTQYHNDAAAEEAKAFFDKNVRKKGDIEWQAITLNEISAHLTTGIATDTPLFEICYALACVNGEQQSSNHFRRVIKQGGVQVDGEKVTDTSHTLDLTSLESVKIKVGKRGFYELSNA